MQEVGLRGKPMRHNVLAVVLCLGLPDFPDGLRVWAQTAPSRERTRCWSKKDLQVVSPLRYQSSVFSTSRVNFKCRFQGLTFFGENPPFGRCAKGLSNCLSVEDCHDPLVFSHRQCELCTCTNECICLYACATVVVTCQRSGCLSSTFYLVNTTIVLSAPDRLTLKLTMSCPSTTQDRLRFSTSSKMMDSGFVSCGVQ